MDFQFQAQKQLPRDLHMAKTSKIAKALPSDLRSWGVACHCYLGIKLRPFDSYQNGRWINLSLAMGKTSKVVP